jgi:AcrR family transcriptional regulator
MKLSQMSWRDRTTSRRGYHHGNLREALVRAALDLIAEFGPGGFSFAEAARRAGVSPAAPYRHFRDRDALVVEIARRGFGRLADDLTAAWAEEKSGPLNALKAMGNAYLAFARREPAYYAAMFESGVAASDDAGLQREGDRAFSALRHAAVAVSHLLPADRRAPPHMMSLHIWAMSHGIAALFGAGKGRAIPVSPEDLLEASVLIYLQGLGLGSAVEPPAGKT